MRGAELKRYYQLKFKEAPNQHHKRILALAVRELIRLAYCLLSTHRFILHLPECRCLKTCRKCLFLSLLR